MSGLVVLGAGRYLGGGLLRLRELRHQENDPVAHDWAPTFERNRNVMMTNGFDAVAMRAHNAQFDTEEIARSTGFDRVSVNSIERSEEIAVKACRKTGFGEESPDAIIVCQSQSDSRAHENSSVALRLQNEFKIKNFVFGLMDQEAAAGVRAIDLAATLVADGQAADVLLCGVQKIVQPFPRILTGHTVLGDGAAACRLSAAEALGWCIDFTASGTLGFFENPWSVFEEDIDLEHVADGIADFVSAALRARGLTMGAFDVVLRSGLNGQLDRSLCKRLACPEDAPAFPSKLGYFGSADVPMMLNTLCALYPSSPVGRACLLVAAGFGGRVGLAALSYRQNTPRETAAEPQVPVFVHGTGYYVPETSTPLTDWGQRNAVPAETLAEAGANGVRIFRDSRDVPVYDLVSKAVFGVFGTSGFDPAAIDLVLVAHTSSFPIIPGPGDIIHRLCRDFGMPCADGFSVGQQNCVSIISAIRIASLLLRRKSGIDNVLIASGDQIRSEIDIFRLLGTTAIQSDGGSALILSRHPSDTRLESAYNYADTANWLGRLDDVESNKSFILYNVRLIRRLLKEAGIAPDRLASCLTPNINRGAWGHILQSSGLSPGLIDDSLFNHVGHVFGNDWVISLTESTARGPILCLSYGLCDCFGGVVVNRVAQKQHAGLG